MPEVDDSTNIELTQYSLSDLKMSFNSPVRRDDIPVVAYFTIIVGFEPQPKP